MSEYKEPKRKLRYEIPVLGKWLFWRDYRRTIATSNVVGLYGEDPWVVLPEMGVGETPSWYDLEKYYWSGWQFAD
jgi:hypothetical protein